MRRPGNRLTVRGLMGLIVLWGVMLTLVLGWVSLRRRQAIYRDLAAAHARKANAPPAEWSLNPRRRAWIAYHARLARKYGWATYFPWLPVAPDPPPPD